MLNRFVNRVVLKSPECAAHSGDFRIGLFYKKPVFRRKSPECTQKSNILKITRMHISTVIISYWSKYEVVVKKSQTLKFNWLHHTHHRSKETTVTFRFVHVSKSTTLPKITHRYLCKIRNQFTCLVSKKWVTSW